MQVIVAEAMHVDLDHSVDDIRASEMMVLSSLELTLERKENKSAGTSGNSHL